MKWFYVVITKEFAESINGKVVDNVIFNYSITSSGNYVCQFEMLNIFLDDFSALNNLAVILLDTATDF
jgi:hypothetical protein